LTTTSTRKRATVDVNRLTLTSQEARRSAQEVVLSLHATVTGAGVQPALPAADRTCARSGVPMWVVAPSRVVRRTVEIYDPEHTLHVVAEAP